MVMALLSEIGTATKKCEKGSITVKILLKPSSVVSHGPAKSILRVEPQWS